MTKSTPDYCHVDRKLPNYSVFNDYPTEEYRHSSCGTGTYLNWNPLLQNNATGSRICERPSVRRPRSWTPLPQRIPWMPRTMSTWTGGGAVLPCQRGGCGARGEDPRDVCSRNRGGNEQQFRHLLPHRRKLSWSLRTPRTMTTSIRSHPEEEDSSPPQVDPQPLEKVPPPVLQPIQHSTINPAKTCQWSR